MTNNKIMGLLDFLFGNKKEKERLERERLAEQERQRKAEEARLAESRRKEAERRARIEEERRREETKRQSSRTLSIRDIAAGKVFETDLYVSVVKQPYNGEAVSISTNKDAKAHLVRTVQGGNVKITFSNLAELQSKGIIQSNLDLAPQFSYQQDGEGDEFASAEINNSFAAAHSGKEYISLFQMTKQNGEIVSFLINNLPNADDYYYLIMLRANKL